jgi:hydrogenase maturation protein HypF
VHNSSVIKRLRIVLRGAVQGVGFRPFVYRLATELGLPGWVSNTAQGVFIEVEGSPEILEVFQARLMSDKPSVSVIHSSESSYLSPVTYPDFTIRESLAGEKTVIVLPDIATCAACRMEIFDDRNRRYRYPFTNCVHCGPRFSIIEEIPYDRANTSMKCFTMCPACQREYEDPQNRRFHAQPNACPVCGPHLELWNPTGEVLATHDQALQQAAEAIRQGSILALKGLGGFQLLVDARNEDAVARLRERKHREAKPLALMMSSGEAVRGICKVDKVEAGLLESTAAPIVLLGRAAPADCEYKIASMVAPGNPYLGIMLPYTPLHHLLMSALGFPVVATSGNVTDEPICIDEKDALQRLRGIADVFLVHNRPIVRQMDDSVARVVKGREQILRRARGYAPLPVTVKNKLRNVMAVGAHLKNAVAISLENSVFVSQHIGDQDTLPAFEAFRKATSDLPRLYNWRPQVVACDLHPDYRPTQYARDYAEQSGGLVQCIPVQHHYAHVLSCMAENEISAPVLGVVWDGTGYGLDGTIWGGEFLSITEKTFFRVAHWRPFRLVGGEKAIQEPRRSALGLLYEMLGEPAFERHELAPVRAFTRVELDALKSLLIRGVQAPITSSAGRLFDAVASLVDLVQVMQFEGQAGMMLEFALDGTAEEALYPLQLVNRGLRGTSMPSTDLASRGVGQGAAIMVDWEPMIWALVDDVRHQVPVGIISAKFHRTLAEAIAVVAGHVGGDQVVLTGGCFQNRYLTEQAIHRLERDGFRVYWHQRVPPNDGGIALGQVMAANR